MIIDVWCVPRKIDLVSGYCGRLRQIGSLNFLDFRESVELTPIYCTSIEYCGEGPQVKEGIEFFDLNDQSKLSLVHPAGYTPQAV